MRSANFVEETTTSIAGTGGNGAVTLTAIASTPRFSTVFGTQATTIRYVIEDTVGKRFETGIGSVAAHVLTRTRPQVTWDGTTYDDSTPAPIAFGSTPATGTVRVRLSATAESQGVVMPGVNTTIASSAPSWHIYRLSSANFPNPGTARVLTANREYYLAYLLPTAGLLDGIQFEVLAAVAASGLKAALYSCGSNGLPGTRIVDFGNADTTTTGLKTNSATGGWSPAGPVWLNAGWYFVGYIPSHAISVSGSSGAITFSTSPVGLGNGYGYTDTVFAGGSYATGLPASPAPTTMAAVNGADARHAFGLRVIA